MLLHVLQSNAPVLAISAPSFARCLMVPTLIGVPSSSCSSGGISANSKTSANSHRWRIGNNFLLRRTLRLSASPVITVHSETGPLDTVLSASNSFTGSRDWSTRLQSFATLMLSPGIFVGTSGIPPANARAASKGKTKAERMPRIERSDVAQDTSRSHRLQIKLMEYLTDVVCIGCTDSRSGAAEMEEL